jgi:predicted membrane-bound spermidine synthase
MTSRKELIIRSLIFILGFLAMSVQVLSAREFLVLFSGNELVIGICLGLWMLSTAIGAYLGSFLFRRTGASVRWLPLITSFLILVALAGVMPTGMALLKGVLLPRGVEAGFGQVFLIVMFSTMPFCLISGASFTYLAGKLSSVENSSSVHTAYALDSAGSIVGGILFSILIFSIPGSGFQVPGSINSTIFPGQEVLESRDTPYGRLTVTRLGEQYNLYENGNPVLLAGEPAQREEMVHYAMLLHPKPEQVLMISGGIGGTIEEVFKYPGVQVDYLENNPWLIKLVDRYIPFPVNDHLRIIREDPLRFLRRAGEKYDVILLNTPDPVSADLNRFYTREFFTILKARLNADGILSCSTPAAGNYMSEASLQRHSVLNNTLASEFSQIRIIPGIRDYFLASDAPLDGSLWEYHEKRVISNLYVNPGYIDEELNRQRSAFILDQIRGSGGINTDLRPSVYDLVLRQWLDKFGIGQWVIAIVLIILVVMGILFLGPFNLGLFTGGFTVSSLEFLLLLWLQVLFGNIYQVTGLVFALFMAGMAVGANFSKSFFHEVNFRTFRMMQWVLAIFSVIVAGLQWLVPSSVSGSLLLMLIFLLAAIAGLLMGLQFAIATSIRAVKHISNAGQSFASDLLGSAIGIMLITVYIIPLVGIPLAGLFLAGLNLVTIILISLKKRNTGPTPN